MSHDPLDDLLDRSSPRTRATDPAALEAMISSARFQAGSGEPRPRSVRSRRRVIAGGTALAVLLVGGAGAAAATDGFTWSPSVRHPVGAVPFTMSNGFECELRFAEWSGGADPLFVARVNAARAEWHRSTDVIAAVREILPDVLTELDATMVWAEAGDENGEGATAIEEPEPRSREEAEHRLWAREWMAWDLAVSEVEHDHLVNVGLFDSARMAGAESSNQIQCRDLDGEPYVPGAGS